MDDVIFLVFQREIFILEVLPFYRSFRFRYFSPFDHPTPIRRHAEATHLQRRDQRYVFPRLCRRYVFVIVKKISGLRREYGRLMSAGGGAGGGVAEGGEGASPERRGYFEERQINIIKGKRGVRPRTSATSLRCVPGSLGGRTVTPESPARRFRVFRTHRIGELCGHGPCLMSPCVRTRPGE